MKNNKNNREPLLLECEPRIEAQLRAVIREENWSALREVNGYFAAVLRCDDGWLLLRDHMGISPLYYVLAGKCFDFARDIRVLLAKHPEAREINAEKLYLGLRGASTLSNTDTEFAHVYCVRPGSWLKVTETADGYRLREHRYWEPGRKKIRLANDQAYADEMRRLVEDAIRIRLEDIDGTVGAELSGGLDSSVIDILISRMGRDTHFVSWSRPFGELPMQPDDERRVIEDICAQEGKTCTYLPGEMPEELDAVARCLPPCTNTLPLSHTSLILRNAGVRTVFTGHGGDEGVSHRCSRLELLAHHEYVPWLREIYRVTKGKKLRLARTAKRAAADVIRRMPSMREGWQNKSGDLACCMDPGFLRGMEPKVTMKPLRFAYDPAQYIRDGGSRPRIENAVIQGGEFGMRYIFPYLDYRVVDFSLGIPRRLFYRNGEDRWIFREAFRDLMPPSLREVHYKDTPSERALEQRQKAEDFDQEALARDHLDPLDWSRWSRYLDYDACKALLLKPRDTLDEDGQFRQFRLAVMLYTCSLTQNLQDHAEEWLKKNSGSDDCDRRKE